jgi:hypothetical protein
MYGAGLPPVEQFYRDYGDVMCYPTDLTFGQIKETFFDRALSRARFRNYRGVALVLHSGARVLMSTKNVDPADLWKRLKGEIESLPAEVSVS